MTFQFPKPFFGGLFVGADAFDSESLAVRNTFGAMFRMTTLWGQVLMFKEKNANNRVPFVITYHPALSNLSSIVREHWTTIQNTQNCVKLCVLLNLCVHWMFLHVIHRLESHF
jgi:hypothetical protein